MKIIGLLTALAAGSADVGQNYIGMIIGISLVTALLTSLFSVLAFSKPKKQNNGTGSKDTASEVIISSPKAIAPAVNNGISDEVIAVIAAAVASMAPDGKQYKVRSVSCVHTQRSVWAAAGLADSTRPF